MTIRKEKEIAARSFALGFVTAALNLPFFGIAAVEEMVTAMEEQLEIDRGTAVWYGNQALLLAGKDELCVSPTTPYEKRYKENGPATIHLLEPKDQ